MVRAVPCENTELVVPGFAKAAPTNKDYQMLSSPDETITVSFFGVVCGLPFFEGGGALHAPPSA